MLALVTTMLPLVQLRLFSNINSTNKINVAEKPTTSIERSIFCLCTFFCIVNKTSFHIVFGLEF